MDINSRTPLKLDPHRLISNFPARQAAHSTSHNPMTLLIDAIKAQEDSCVLPTFDSDVAFALGIIIRTHCQRNHKRPVVVYITLASSSQLLFFAASRPGTLPDNMHRIKRKEAVVLRWEMSTKRMRVQLELEQPRKPVQDALKHKYDVTDPSVYACSGGGFPVRVKNVEGIVGVIVVSGLTEDEDHGVIVDSIQEYLKSLNKGRPSSKK